MSRSPELSYLRKQKRPNEPRRKLTGLARHAHPLLAAFTPVHHVKWLVEYLIHRIGRRHPFQDYRGAGSDNGVYRLEGDGDEVRVALAGDWGSGTDEAHEIAQLIDRFEPHYTIHLGDVYFVGDPNEVAENFLGINNEANGFEPCSWPAGSCGSFALNGNHEMYALGYAYFDRMLPSLGLRVGDRPKGQHASFFCLENDHWRIIALDTAYNSIGWPILEYISNPDCALPEPLIDWLHDVVRPRDDDPRGIILLSHHQYVSRFDHCFTTPARQLAAFFPQPVLWFWGHEHRLAVYEKASLPGAVTAFGRCIGHGGMPVDLSPPNPKHPQYPVEFVDDRLYPNDENLKIGFNGFARLTLRGKRLSIDYVDIKGAVVFAEAWDANEGVLCRIR
ncbi:MAG TPA: metallophosphoesterase [Stellaceae bacterium]|nr:metallophosphoesterase [Stellaceae bacterium]